MILTTQQQEALNGIASWFCDPSKRGVFALMGAAGTGKTALLQRIASVLPSGTHIDYLSPTHQARKVLEQTGVDASTVHSKTMRFLGKKDDGTILFSYKSIPEEDRPNLLIVDEASMVGGKLRRSLMEQGIPIVAVGDPHQLPPVEGSWNDSLLFHDITDQYTLNEIHRQAAGDPILAIAHAVKDGNVPAPRDFDQTRVIRGCPDVALDYLHADAVIVWTNKLRHHMNREYRRRLGLPMGPQKGEILIKSGGKYDEQVTVASRWLIKSIERCTQIYRVNPDRKWEAEPRDHAKVLSETKSLVIYERRYLKIRARSLETGKTKVLNCSIDPLHHRNDYWMPWSEWEHSMDFTYAITAHKAQGSQFRQVVVLDDVGRMRTDRDRRAWRYTAVTRAQESLIYVLLD